MLSVQSVNIKFHHTQRWQDHGKRLMRARSYFAIGLGILIITSCGVPAAWWWFGAQTDGTFGLFARLAVFFGNIAALAWMLMAIGVGVTGQRIGVLWTARNAYSLSRLQVILWTLLVLAALAAVVVCRAHGLFLTPASAGVGTALHIDIPTPLLTVMGISVFSGAAAPAILSLKAQSYPATQYQLVAAETRVGGGLAAVGNVTFRPSDCPPLVKDLFQGDEVSKAGTVDVGKVQQAIVTAILWCSYFAMLIQMFATGASPQSATLPGGTALPLMPDTFVYLLAISHAGYIAYKAAPSPGGTTVGTVASVQLPSSMLPRPLPPTL